MRLLLDTHVLLWAQLQPDRLEGARELLLDPAHELFVSSVTTFEVTVKHALGRLGLPDAPGPWVAESIQALGAVPIALEHADAAAGGRLPRHHADPFDRLLLGTALRRGWTLLTKDATMSAYDVPVVWT